MSHMNELPKAMDYPTRYREARDLFERKSRGRERVKLAHNTYLEPLYEIMGGTVRGYAIVLHDTRIVQFYRTGWTTLDTGGWQTLTTRDRMRRAGVAIFAAGGVVGVSIPPRPGCILSKAVAFCDGMRIRGHQVSGAGILFEDAQRKRRAALRKDRNRVYVRRLATRQFSEYIIGGNVPEAFQVQP